MRLPRFGWIIICPDCDNIRSPYELFYLDKDWACQDAKERNEDHPGHKVTAVKLVQAAIVKLTRNGSR